MQALAARQAAFCSSSSSAGRRPAARSRRAVTVRADVGFCRDKISERQDLTDQIEGTSVVVFLGADGAEVPVECPKVRWEGLGRMCGGGSNTEGGCKRLFGRRKCIRSCSLLWQLWQPPQVLSCTQAVHPLLSLANTSPAHPPQFSTSYNNCHTAGRLHP